MQRERPVARARYMRNGPREGACTLFLICTVIAGLYAYELPIYHLRTEILSTPYIAYCVQFICLMLLFIVVFRSIEIASRHLECSDLFFPRQKPVGFLCVSKNYKNGIASPHGSFRSRRCRATTHDPRLAAASSGDPASNAQ